MGPVGLPQLEEIYKTRDEKTQSYFCENCVISIILICLRELCITLLQNKNIKILFLLFTYYSVHITFYYSVCVTVYILQCTYYSVHITVYILHFY